MKNSWKRYYIWRLLRIKISRDQGYRVGMGGQSRNGMSKDAKKNEKTGVVAGRKYQLTKSWGTDEVGMVGVAMGRMLKAKILSFRN